MHIHFILSSCIVFKSIYIHFTFCSYIITLSCIIILGLALCLHHCLFNFHLHLFIYYLYYIVLIILIMSIGVALIHRLILSRFQRAVKYVSPCFSPVALLVPLAYFTACSREIGDLPLVPSGPLFMQYISYTKSCKLAPLTNVKSTQVMLTWR